MILELLESAQCCVEVTWKIGSIAEACVVPLKILYFVSYIHFAIGLL